MNGPARWAVVLDFDGTVTTHDIGDSILRRFGGVEDRELRSSYHPDVITEDWVREKFLRVRQSRDTLDRFILRIARARAGFARLVAWCREHAVPVEIVSGGLDLYLDTLLKHWNLGDIPRWRATARCTSRGVQVRYGFLKGQPLDEFKRSRVRRLQKSGRRVLFAGDGTSDLGAARAADVAYARGALLRYCRREGRPVSRLETFDGLRRRLERLCSRR